MKASLLLLKKIGDELLTDGSYNTLYDSLTPLPEAVKAYNMATSATVKKPIHAGGDSSNS
jgi:hypothetical protein